jgi:probable F420-dependent oxidoreductase
MKFFFYFPGRWVPVNRQLVTGPVYRTLAIAAEKAGFYGVAMDEHPAPVGSWLRNHGHHSFDPFVLLAAAGAVTSRIKLLTYLAVLPYRNPFMFTKTATSLDAVSDGRLILGVGVGYLKGEFEALGVDYEKRNDLFDEVISVFRRACTGDPITHKGFDFDAKEVEIIPPAIQRPHPPLWLGGNAHRTRKRVVEYGQGWIPMPLKRSQTGVHKTPPLENPADMKRFLDEMREYADKIGRKAPIDVVISSGMLELKASPANLIAQIKEYEALGVNGVTVNGRGDTPVEAEKFVDTFGHDVISAFGTP